MVGKRRRSDRIEISADDARQAGVPRDHAPKSGRTPRSLVAVFALGLGAVALAFWLVLTLVL